MSFKISYEDLKVLLNVFYGAPYRQVVGIIEMLHALKEEDTDLTLKQKVDIEVALNSQSKEE